MYDYLDLGIIDNNRTIKRPIPLLYHNLKIISHLYDYAINRIISLIR